MNKSLLKRMPLLLLLACIVPAIVGAQSPPAHPQRDAAAQRLKDLSKELNLTDAQKDKIRPILQEEAPKVKALRDDTTLTRQEKAEKLRAIHDETSSQIQPILTAEQSQKLEQAKQAAVKKRKAASHPS